MKEKYRRNIMWILLFSFSYLVSVVLTTLTPPTRIQSYGDQQSDSARLFEHLFRRGKYHKELRPVRNLTKPVDVRLQLWFKQVLKVDEVDQVLTFYCWLEEYWRDEYLTWNPRDFGGINTLLIPHGMIWRPDVLVYNNANMNVKDAEHLTNAHINSTGHVSLFMAVITDIACALDMTYFPFDQVCFVMFASWSYDGTKMNISPIQASEPTKFYIENSEWTLKAFDYRKNLKHYECCVAPYPDIAYFFVIERNPAYYVVSLIVPSAFITTVTIVGFFIPHSSSGENTEKVSLGVTALLSLAIILLMVADKMPATSKVMPLIGKYYIGLIIVIFVASCTTAITLSIQLRGNAGEHIDPWIRNFFFERVAKWFFIRVNLLHYTPGYPNNFANDGVSETTFLLHSQYTIGQDGVGVEGGGRKRNRSKDSSTLTEVILEELVESVTQMRAELKEQKRLEEIKKEWGQLARISERVLMFTFMVTTLLFAWVMLSTRGPPILLTEQLMAQAND